MHCAFSFSNISWKSLLFLNVHHNMLFLQLPDSTCKWIYFNFNHSSLVETDFVPPPPVPFFLNKCSDQYPCIQIFSVMVGCYLLTLTLNLPSSLRITNCCGMPCSEVIPSMLDFQCKNWDSPRSISWCLWQLVIVALSIFEGIDICIDSVLRHINGF